MTTLTPTTVGSLRFLMDQLVAAQQAVLDSPLLAERNLQDDLTLFRYRCAAVAASTPALYNVPLPATSAQRDLARRADLFVVETRIGVAVGQEEDERYEDLEVYCDAYRDVMDPVFRREIAGGPAPVLGGACRWAERGSAGWFADDLGTPVVGYSFQQTFDVPRIVTPSA